MGTPDSLLTTAQAARLLGVTPAHVRRLAARGDLLCEVTPYGRLYRREAVERRRARPPRPGRPAQARRALRDATFLAPVDDRVTIYVEREATVTDPSGAWHYPAGRPYIVFRIVTALCGSFTRRPRSSRLPVSPGADALPWAGERSRSEQAPDR